MASFFAYWTPARKSKSTQTFQYKKSVDSLWTTKATLSPYVDSYGIEDLEENTSYDFRVLNSCGGNQTVTLTTSRISLTCPEINTQVVVVDDVMRVNYSFEPSLNTDVDKYRIELYTPQLELITYNQHTGPFTSPITGGFTINSSGEYSIGAKVYSGETIKSCPTSIPVYVCITINHINATIS